MMPTDPAPSQGSSGHAAPGAAGRGSHHDDEHLYDQAEIQNEDVDHEHSDVNVRAIIAYAVGMAVVVAVCAVASYGLMQFFEHQAAANDPVVSPLAQPAGQLPPEPRLIEDEPKNLQQFRDALAERLKGIDEGKRQFLQQGLPVRADAPTDPWMGTHSPATGEASGGRTIPVRPGAGAQAPVPPPGPPAAPPAPPKGGGH